MHTNGGTQKKSNHVNIPIDESGRDAQQFRGAHTKLVVKAWPQNSQPYEPQYWQRVAVRILNNPRQLPKKSHPIRKIKAGMFPDTVQMEQPDS